MAKPDTLEIPLQPEEETEDDVFFMRMAAVAAKRSKLEEKVGAVIASEKKQLLGYGYNGTPINHGYPGPIVVDAHTNAILFSSRPLEGSTMYTTQIPDAAAAAHIVQAQIKEIKYLCHQDRPDEPTQHIRSILKGVSIAPLRLRDPLVSINFADFGRAEQAEEREEQPHDKDLK